MKKLILTLSIASIIYSMKAQNTFPSSGSVGIGTTSPTQTLDVRGAITWFAGPTPVGVLQNDNNGGVEIGPVNSTTASPYIDFHYGVGSLQDFNVRLQNAGNNLFNITTASGGPVFTINGSNIGIGTLSPSSSLAISSSNSVNPNKTGADIPYSAITFQNASAGNNFNVGRIAVVQENGNYVDAGAIAFSTGGGGLSEKMRLNSAGNLLIGKMSQTNTAYKFDVSGAIRSNSIVVNTTGADFVFQPGYKLIPLLQVSNYIFQHHHLPEVASAAQMKANGLNLGENQIKLLQKVEELTLYLIDQQAKASKQQTKIDDLQNQVRKMAAQLNTLLTDKK